MSADTRPLAALLLPASVVFNIIFGQFEHPFNRLRISGDNSIDVLFRYLEADLFEYFLVKCVPVICLI